MSFLIKSNTVLIANKVEQLYQIMRNTPPPAARRAPNIINLHLCFAQNAWLLTLVERYLICCEIDYNFVAFLTAISTFSYLCSTLSTFSFI